MSQLIIFAANPGIPKRKFSLLKNAGGRVTTSKRMKNGSNSDLSWPSIDEDYVVFAGLHIFWVMNKHLRCTLIDHQIYMCNCNYLNQLFVSLYQYTLFFAWLIACLIIRGSASSAVQLDISGSDSNDTWLVEIVSLYVTTNPYVYSACSSINSWQRNW